MSFVYTPKLVNDLGVTMGALSRSDRRRVFDSIISTIDSSHPLPSLRSITSLVLNSIVDTVNGLYRGLAALDYRIRLKTFPSVFRTVDRCLLVVRNEHAYRWWLD